MEPAPASFRLGVAEGVIPTTWLRRWQERLPGVGLEVVALGAIGGEAWVLEGRVDAGLIRPPAASAGLHVIPLYEETPVVIAAKDHYVAAADELSVEDLSQEIVQEVLDGVEWPVPLGIPAREAAPTTADAIQLVAAGVGVLVVPQSLARLHARKDLISRPMVDLPHVPVGLVWKEGNDSPLIEELVGIVRGRTAASTRGRPQIPSRKRTAAEKAAARRAYLAEQRSMQGGLSRGGQKGDPRGGQKGDPRSGDPRRRSRGRGR